MNMKKKKKKRKYFHDKFFVNLNLHFLLVNPRQYFCKFETSDVHVEICPRSTVPVTEETRHRGLHKGPSEGTKPTPVRDHQGAATPPADRAYLCDLLHVHMTRSHVHTHTHTYTPHTHTTDLVRVNDSNVPRGRRWWIQEDTQRNGSPRITPRLVHASFLREAETDYEKGQGDERETK